MRFYGLSLEEVENMDVATYGSLYQSLHKIEAHEQLLAMQVSDWPNATKEYRKKTHRKLVKLSELDDQKKILSSSELREKLNKELNGLY